MANGTAKVIPPAPWEQPAPSPVPKDARRTETATPGYAQPSAEYRSQQGKDVVAGVARYGGPIAGGLLFPASITAQAGTTAISEFTARQIERAGSDPELQSIWADLQAGGLAGGVDLGFSLLFKGIGAGVRKLGQRLFLPKELPPAIEMAQETLSGASRTKTKTALLSRWQKWIGGGKSRPFSLTFGQLNAEEQGFISWLEGVSRSSLGGRGMMQRFDLRNEKVVTKLFDDYTAMRMTQMTDPEIGVFVERVLGSKSPGEAFKPVEAFRKYLYKQFDDGLARTSTTIDGTKLRDFIVDRQDELVSKTYRGLRAEGVLPNLTDDTAWSTLSAADVDKTIRGINSGWRDGADTDNKILSYMRRRIEPEFEELVNSVPGLNDIWQTAKKYKALENENFQNKLILSLRKKLTDTPSAVANMLDAATGDPATTYDKLMRVKDTLYFSAAAPSSPEIPGGGLGTRAVEKMWDKSIIRPLRYRFISHALDDGILNPTKLLNQIEKIESTTPELLTELFGGSSQIEYIKRLANTLNIVNQKGERNIFIQLKQAGAIGTVGAAAGAGVAAYTDDNPAIGAVKGATFVLVSPIALSYVLNRPTLVRMLTDGLEAGPKSHVLAVALRKIGGQKLASSAYKELDSSRSVEYFTQLPSQQE